MMPSEATSRKVTRQPAAWPMRVPSGTPTMLATVRPMNISEIAEAFFCGATRSAATTEPMPKNAPCAREATIRPISMMPKAGARAESALPTTKSAIRNISIFFLDTLVPRTVRSRGTEDDAEGVAGDQPAGGRDGDAEVVRDLGQHTHDHEFGGADPEGPDGQSQERERHGGDLPNDCR
ncbi:hypothetical protein GCM10020256_66880 [Streptomyces thermocoprophilus]